MSEREAQALLRSVQGISGTHLRPPPSSKLVVYQSVDAGDSPYCSFTASHSCVVFNLRCKALLSSLPLFNVSDFSGTPILVLYLKEGIIEERTGSPNVIMLLTDGVVHYDN